MARSCKKTSADVIHASAVEIPTCSPVAGVASGGGGAEGVKTSARNASPVDRANQNSPGSAPPLPRSMAAEGLEEVPRKRLPQQWSKPQPETFEEATASLRARLGSVRDEPNPGRPSRRWLDRENQTTPFDFEQVLVGTELVVTLREGGPAIAARIHSMRAGRFLEIIPWGCNEPIAFSRAAVKSLRTLPAHTWAERQAVSREQRARFEKKGTE